MTRQVAEFPALGSARYAAALGLPNLRHRQLRRFRYLVFYAERDDRIDIVRVLHAERDIPVFLRGAESTEEDDGGEK